MRLPNGRLSADARVLTDSDYFLPQDYVDQFANEIRGHKGPALRRRKSGSDFSDSDASNAESMEGDPTDGLQNPSSPDGEASAQSITQKLLDACVKNWKANSSDEAKKTWAIFEETGIFIAACRHGMILWIIDMVRSGEL